MPRDPHRYERNPQARGKVELAVVEVVERLAEPEDGVNVRRVPLRPKDVDGRLLCVSL